MESKLKNYNFYEKNIISNKDRFGLSSTDRNELKKNFSSKNIFITGAAGSIGKAFCKELLNYNFKNLYLMDKNENELTELNRELVLLNNKKINKINFLCSDLTLINIDDFLNKNKINIYLNFAAIKHVRSEEELISLKYMFLTNSKSFLPAKPHYLKKIFSISTDKAVNSTSLLGISKSLMEENLFKFKKQNKRVFVSSARFGNVSFSNGSVLKYAADRISEKKIFGIPKTIKRYFITHEEACSLCFKSLLKRNDGNILIPNNKILKKQYFITEIIEKVLKLKKYKPKYINKVSIKNFNINKYYPILLTTPNTYGQKYYEEFYNSSEKRFLDKKDKTILKIKLLVKINAKNIVDNILKMGSEKKIRLYLNKKLKSYTPPKNVKKISKSL